MQPNRRRRAVCALAGAVAAGVVFGSAPIAAAPAAPGIAAPVATVQPAAPTATVPPAAPTASPTSPTPSAASAPLRQGTRPAPPPAAEPTVAPLHNDTVVLYGDSLAWEARAAFALAFNDRGVEVHERTFGGTAICDWLQAMDDDAATLRPGAVVVEFSGNNFTPCMHGPDGQPLTGDALVERYAADAAAVVATFAPHGTQVIFGGAPVARDDHRDDHSGDPVITRLNDVYRRVAEGRHHVRYSDAGASVLEGGSWTATLPCLTWEPCGAEGANVVRAPDGLHFCPASRDAVRGVTGDCPVWSSGAVRFGAALAAPVLEHLDAA